MEKDELTQAWQSADLINSDAIDNLSEEDLDKVAKILEKIKL
jgi:hypothetical protein